MEYFFIWFCSSVHYIIIRLRWRYIRRWILRTSELEGALRRALAFSINQLCPCFESEWDNRDRFCSLCSSHCLLVVLVLWRVCDLSNCVSFPSIWWASHTSPCTNHFGWLIQYFRKHGANKNWQFGLICTPSLNSLRRLLVWEETWVFLYKFRRMSDIRTEKDQPVGISLVKNSFLIGPACTYSLVQRLFAGSGKSNQC